MSYLTLDLLTVGSFAIVGRPGSGRSNFIRHLLTAIRMNVFGSLTSAYIVDNAEIDGKRRDDSERVFVIWGSQPSASKAAHGGHGLADARSNLGVKTVVIDPYMTADAVKKLEEVYAS